MFVDVKLLPCPCCGKKDQITVEGGWKHGKCNRCGFACSVQQVITKRKDSIQDLMATLVVRMGA